ncbi:predicted protein [Nematostella vectensis]|uniref:Uncharacterized protein n=1 Tax=Nematostella vectensis TaxID=45351 RepID=A7SKK5_NEMVE|nr:predicted protein [Nematostella vectensis]|eukprot:XP_001627849.1 predicted protein [Nematostella vectensis]
MGIKIKFVGIAVLGVLLAAVYPTLKKNYTKHVKPHMQFVGKVYTAAKEFNVLGYHIPWRFILPVLATFVAYKLFMRRRRRKQLEAERLRQEQAKGKYMTEAQAPQVPATKEVPKLAPPKATIETEIIDPNDLNLVGARVRTFNFWPATSSANVFELARAGFVFTGRDDVVECFKCKGTLKQWKVDDRPIESHREFYPDCPLLTELDKNANKVDATVTRLKDLKDVNDGVARRIQQLQAAQSSANEKGARPAEKHIGELQKRLDTTERTMHLVMKQMEAVTKCLAKTLADDPALSGDKSLAEITEGLTNMKESNV